MKMMMVKVRMLLMAKVPANNCYLVLPSYDPGFHTLIPVIELSVTTHLDLVQDGSRQGIEHVDILAALYCQCGILPSESPTKH